MICTFNRWLTQPYLLWIFKESTSVWAETAHIPNCYRDSQLFVVPNHHSVILWCYICFSIPCNHGFNTHLFRSLFAFSSILNLEPPYPWGFCSGNYPPLIAVTTDTGECPFHDLRGRPPPPEARGAELAARGASEVSRSRGCPSLASAKLRLSSEAKKNTTSGFSVKPDRTFLIPYKALGCFIWHYMYMYISQYIYVYIPMPYSIKNVTSSFTGKLWIPWIVFFVCFCLRAKSAFGRGRGCWAQRPLWRQGEQSSPCLRKGCVHCGGPWPNSRISESMDMGAPLYYNLFLPNAS